MKMGGLPTGGIVLLNAFPVSAFPQERFAAAFERVPLQQLVSEAKEAGCDKIVNFIRHPATVSTLSSALTCKLEPVAGFYEYKPHDTIYVITVKQLPVRGVEIPTVRPEDLDIIKVKVE